MGTIAATFLLSAASVGTAQAITYTNAGIVRATATFNSTTNVLSVYDANTDGWGAYSDWAMTGAPLGSGRLVNESGAGTTVSKTFTVGGWLVYNICSKNGSVTIGCTTGGGGAI